MLLGDGTLDDTQALATAVIVALGTDRLAAPDDILPDPDCTDRAGWWGDMDAEELFNGWPIGTRLWLLKRAKIVGPEDPEGATVARVEQYISEAIQPFVDHADRDQLRRRGVARRHRADRRAGGDLSRAENARSSCASKSSGTRLRGPDVPWSTPTLKEVRGLVRDNIRASLPGADASVPNSVLRVLSDAQGGLCHLTLQYIDWLALQLLPDTAETEWLDRHGAIWLVNSDGTKGRKQATFADGIVPFTGTVRHRRSRWARGYRAAPVELRDHGRDHDWHRADRRSGAGARSRQRSATSKTATHCRCRRRFPASIARVTVVEITGGVDTENDDDLRARILQRIQNPPMGGSQADYVTWALAVPGVTRAWAAAEQGIGTITVRFLMDELRADDDGWPTPTDVQTVDDYIDKMRPVTVKDCYVVAPIKQFIDVTIHRSGAGHDAPRARSRPACSDMLFELAAPGQTIYAAWISYAIMNATGVQSFKLVTTDDYVMPSLGHMAVLGTILFDEPTRP